MYIYVCAFFLYTYSTNFTCTHILTTMYAKLLSHQAISHLTSGRTKSDCLIRAHSRKLVSSLAASLAVQSGARQDVVSLPSQ